MLAYPTIDWTLDDMLNAEIKLPVRFLDADWNAFITGERPAEELDSLVANINEVIEKATK